MGDSSFFVWCVQSLPCQREVPPKAAEGFRRALRGLLARASGQSPSGLLRGHLPTVWGGLLRTASPSAKGSPYRGAGRAREAGGALALHGCSGCLRERAGRACPVPTALRSYEFFGNVTRMVVPVPTWLCRSIFASCSRAMCLTMASPKPVPPVALERLLSTR